MSKHLSILVLCGGQSTEHDISLLSAKNVIERLDPKKYNVSVVKIAHDGAWHYFKNAEDYFSHSGDATRAPEGMNRRLYIHIIPGKKNPLYVDDKSIPVD